MDRDGDDPLAARGLGGAQEGVARHGTAVPRGQDLDPGSDPPQGRFGRMFGLSACEVGLDEIEELVKWMRHDDPTRRSENTDIPAGFTYLGQFIDHDITFDPTSELDRRNDPHALVNFRTPRFDLDSVYGSGPVAQPFLYDWESKPPGTRLLIGHNAVDPALAATLPPLASEDLPRNQQGRALIGDARNDENVIIAQLHLLFIRFHNAVVDHLCPEGDVQEDERDELFEAAQQIVRWHYQWIVVHEFLPMVVGKTMAERVLTPAPAGMAPTVHREHFSWQSEPFIPVEFSAAAYRFGHSMVRSEYGIQRRARRATRLFPDLEGLAWLPRRLVVDWERFFELPEAKRAPEFSQLINTAIVKPLWDLPESGKALPRLNLERGWALGLPSGQAVAGAMDEPALSDEELLLDETVPRRARKALLRATPLWYYILCEAAKSFDRQGRPQPGSHLGPVGGRIVAEVLVGLLEGDPSSYLSTEPTWRPQEFEEVETRGDFTMADLVKIAQRPPLGSRRRRAPRPLPA